MVEIAMDYYSEFLEFSRSQIDNFFKNVPLFENQFKFSEESKNYYQKIFLDQRNAEKIKTVAELKNEIPGYSKLYKEAAKYYSVPRNKSVKGLDVRLGIFLEDLLIDFLNKRFKLNVKHADKKNKQYPDCMLLGPDRGILAYFDLKYHSAPFIQSKRYLGREPYESSATLDVKKVTKQIELIDTELDRPCFYVHWLDYHDLKGIFFESSNQVKDYIYNNGIQFNRKDREGDYSIVKKVGYTEKVYSPLFNMGTFDEFVDVLIDLKKNGVPEYDY